MLQQQLPTSGKGMVRRRTKTPDTALADDEMEESDDAIMSEAMPQGRTSRKIKASPSPRLPVTPRRSSSDNSGGGEGGGGSGDAGILDADRMQSRQTHPLAAGRRKVTKLSPQAEPRSDS